MISTECKVGTRVWAWARLPSDKPLKKGTLSWQEGVVIENHHVKLDRGPTVGICKVTLASPSSEGLS